LKEKVIKTLFKYSVSHEYWPLCRNRNQSVLLPKSRLKCWR